jgi:diguanylate cyclase (GGDEF)-like protein/PAS domain S-box-containing protein
LVASYALLVGLTSAVLVWFKLPDPLMILLTLPVFFVGIGHPTRVYRWMIMILAIGSIWVEIILSLNFYKSLITTVILTVTILIVVELLRAFDARRNQAESMLETQRDLAAALGSMNQVDEALNKILDTVCRIEGLDSGGVQLVDPATGNYHFTVYRGISIALAERMAFFTKDSSQARLISAGHPLYQSYSILAPMFGLNVPSDEGLRAVAIIPVMYQGKLIAALIIGSHTKDEIPFPTRHALEVIAAQVGDVIARIRAEEASQDSRINFESFFDTLDDFLFILNEGGQILHCNPLVSRRLGYSAEELSEMNVLELHPPQQKEAVKSIFASMLAGECTLCPIPLMTKDGREIPVETKAARGRWNNQEVLFGISRDISERLQAEEALRENEELYRNLIESQGEGLAIVDQEENFIFANPASDRIFGLAKGNLVGHNLSEFVQTSQFEIIRTETAKRMRGERSSYEMEIRRPDGETRNLLTTVTPRYGKTGEFNGSFGIFSDITERARAEEALRASEQKFRNLIEQSHDGIVLIDESGMVIEWNQAMEQITGMERHVVFGQPCWDVLGSLTQENSSPDNREKLKQAILSSLQSGEGIFLYHSNETNYLNTRGETRVTTQTIFPIRTQKGFQIGGISHDITERKLIEEKLRQTNEQLTRWLNELEAHNQETSLLKEMGDLLQSCREIEEAYQVFDQFIRQLFPASGGALYVFEETAGNLEAVSTWGEKFEETSQINREDCWALRRGRPHRVDDPQKGLVCPHVQISAKHSSLCVPMVAQSESIGLLHIYFSHDAAMESIDYTDWLNHHENLAITLADQIGMALANLKMHKILSEQVNHDSLTGLFNQKYFLESLQREIHRSIRRGGEVSLLIVEIGHLTEINALYGQDAKNQVLAAGAKFLEGNVKPGEVACRYRGNLFGLIFPDVSYEAACLRAEDLLDGFKLLRFEYQDKEITQVTLSIGISIYPELGKDSESLLLAAETALKLAKGDDNHRVNLPEK